MSFKKENIEFLDVSPQEIANYFLNKENHDITNVKLNKLLYISFGWFAAYHKLFLFEEKIEAWKFGPVIPSIYHQFKIYGKNRIDSKAVTNYKDIPLEPDIRTSRFNERDMVIDVLEEIWILYGHKTASELIEITYSPESPWSQTYYKQFKNKISKYSTEINKEQIYNYYKNFMEEEMKEVEANKNQGVLKQEEIEALLKKEENLIRSF